MGDSGNVGVTPHVYKAIAQVMEALAHEGIAKSRKNESQGYKFRGIDDVYNALAPLMAKAGLVVLPAVLSREVVERRTRTDTALFYVTVRMQFTFISSLDGSQCPVVTCGEAMDSGDKATNKAMSAAFKYAAMQTFCIPTEGDNDADAQTHTVMAPDAKPKVEAKPAPQLPPQPEDEEPKKMDDRFVERIRGVRTTQALRILWEGMTPQQRSTYQSVFTARKQELAAADGTAH